MGEYSSDAQSDADESEGGQLSYSPAYVDTDPEPPIERRQLAYNPALQTTVADPVSRSPRLSPSHAAPLAASSADRAPTLGAGSGRHHPNAAELPSDPQRLFKFDFQFDRVAVLAALDRVLHAAA
mmetsp:Transcript_42732/g.107867  ORF Transcript_42732/g.107867 Transcript_42732/m.107867 type:complete len:125 (+) Transcript_42732:754-1128(+)